MEKTDNLQIDYNSSRISDYDKNGDLNHNATNSSKEKFLPNLNANPKIFIVGGLLYGDEGKGTTVEFLSSKYNSNLVVRYGGGPQAAHHVVLENGIWHCFSQLSSGSFEKNCSTLLSKFMLINPITLLCEIEVISKKGVSEEEILSKLFIDKSCFIITPYHKLVNVSKEILRKNSNHGSTGLGVGVALDEAMYTNLDYFPKAQVCYDKEKIIDPNNRNYAHFNFDCITIQVSDLFDRNLFFKKLKKLIEEKISHVYILIQEYYKKNNIDPNLCAEDKYVKEVQITIEKFKNEYSLVKLLKLYLDWFEKFKKHDVFIDNGADLICEFLNNEKYSNNIVFEGSQGSLLDRIYGFYPHITKTLCSLENAEKLINEIRERYSFGNIEIYKIGVLRIYSSRHGKGPFLTESQHWSETIKEQHNENGRFQGSFKIGPFDLLGAKYGCEIFKPDFLSITCIDRIAEKVRKTKANNNNNKFVFYKEKIDDVDFYFCQFYFLDFYKLIEDKITNSKNNKKNKRMNLKNNDMQIEEKIKQYLDILMDLKKKGILDLMEFENKKNFEDYLINDKLNFNDGISKFSFVKEYFINCKEEDINTYSEKGLRIIIITNINKGNDFFNFKNESLTKILEMGKPIYFRLQDLSEFNEIIEINENFLSKTSLENISHENELVLREFFKQKVSNFLTYESFKKNLFLIEKELKIPINILSLGPTKNDKILIKDF